MTGVQTCALPISPVTTGRPYDGQDLEGQMEGGIVLGKNGVFDKDGKIGRASCRERV